MISFKYNKAVGADENFLNERINCFTAGNKACVNQIEGEEMKKFLAVMFIFNGNYGGYGICV